MTENDDSLKDELSSLLDELNEESDIKTDEPSEQKKKIEKETISEKIDLNPYVPKRINKLKSGGRLIFKKRNVLGIDIGSSSIKIVQIDTTTKIPLIYGYAFEEIPFDLRNKGQKTEEFIIKALRNLIKEKRLIDSLCESYLSGNGVYVYSGLIDSVAENEVVEAVSSVLEEKITFALDEATLKYTITGETTTRTGDKLEVTAVAAKNDVIKKSVWLIEEAGLQITGISTPSYSFENIFHLKLSSVPSNVVVLNLGSKRTEINYYRDGKFVLNREVSVASSDINKVNITKVSNQGVNITIDTEKAEDLKRNYGVIINPASVKQNPILSNYASLSRPVLEKMSAELKRSLAFFQRSASVSKMDKIFIAGGGGNLNNLSLYFKKELNIDVEPFPVNKYFKIDKKLINEETEGQILNTIIPSCGLFWDKTEGKINLVPGISRFFSRIASYKLIWNLIIIGILSALLLAFVLMTFQNMEITNQLQFSKDQLQLLSEQAKEIESLKSYNDFYLERKKLVESLVFSGPKWNLLLAEISRITSKSIVFKKLEIKISKEGMLIIIGSVDIKKSRLDKSISSLMEKMEQSPFFKHVELVRMEQNRKSQSKLAEFEVKGVLLY
jgi:type IV pilus assembly protein PilM